MVYSNFKGFNLFKTLINFSQEHDITTIMVKVSYPRNVLLWVVEGKSGPEVEIRRKNWVRAKIMRALQLSFLYIGFSILGLRENSGPGRDPPLSGLVFLVNDLRKFESLFGH